MTEQHHDSRPPACHYDRTLGHRVTRHHRDDCTTPETHDGCAPCTAPHCLVCHREHTTNSMPETCPACVGKIRADLETTATSYAALGQERLDAGRDGRLVAAAPIPGGVAAVLTGPSVRLDRLRTGSVAGVLTLAKDHRPEDPIPPLAVLAQWEDMWRTHLGHAPGRLATVASACAYLAMQLDYMAQRTNDGGPDFLEFTRQVRDIRARLERALHDERTPQLGVECFECGDRLVRRFRDRLICRHPTKARRQLQAHATRRAAAQDWLRTLATYPELQPGHHHPDDDAIDTPTRRELQAAAAPPASLIAAARQPCTDCATQQGGIDDPRAGMSWECLGCRKEYSPGEYATAVRRDLLTNGADGDGWTHITMAAEAASTMTGHPIPAATVRKWVDRGKVSSKLDARGTRLVFWPEVAEEANAAVERAIAAAAERRRKVELEAQLWDAIAAGEKPRVAGKRLGLRRARIRELCEAWANEGRLTYRRAPDLGWVTAS